MIIKECNRLLKQMKAVVDDMYQYTMKNETFLQKLVPSAIDIDGRESTEMTIFAPLFQKK